SISNSRAKLKENDYFLGWKVDSINPDTVILKKEQSTKFLRKGINKVAFPPSLDITVLNLNIPREVSLSVVPYTIGGRSTVSFDLHVAVEKRLIKIGPKAAAEQANKTREISAQIKKITDSLGNSIETGKQACFATYSALLLKNFVQSYKGEAVARKRVMDSFKDECKDKVGFNKQYNNYHECFLAQENEIERAVGDMQKAIDKTDALLKEVTVKKEDITEVDPNKLKEVLKREFPNVDIDEQINTISRYEEKAGHEILLPSEVKELVFTLSANKEFSDEKDGSVLREDYKVRTDNKVNFYNENAEEFTKVLAEYEEFKQKLKDQSISPDMSDPELLNYFLEIRQQQGTLYAPQAITSGGKTYVYVYQTKEWKEAEREGNTLTYTIEKDEKKEKITIPIKTSCVDQKEGYQIQYYGSGSNSGLPAVVPFPIESGEGYIKVNKYDSSGKPLETLLHVPIAGDCQNIFYRAGQDIPSVWKNSIDKGLEAVRIATLVQMKEAGRKAFIFGKAYPIGRQIVEAPSAQCEDFMSISDCEILFQVCDPVMCPSSRCNFGGRWQVSDVVQTGVIGSIALCAPNFPHPVLPVCLPGVRAGLLNYASILDAYAQCLDESRTSGKTTGICDQIRSIYTCEFIWREGMAIANAEGG
ncbi:MAG: hypothetical protein AABX59_00585, partial [Nanoarchaeota archaeon]